MAHLAELHDRTGRLEILVKAKRITATSRPHRSLRKLYLYAFCTNMLHDRTGRLEIFTEQVREVTSLHDRTGRLENKKP
ncbi:Heat shock protein GrpE [Moraxella catarrhalis]|nr:Heat shock protein GrpE [Moraxella catarrhalis]